MASSRATTSQPSVLSDFADADDVSVSGADALGPSGTKSPSGIGYLSSARSE